MVTRLSRMARSVRHLTGIAAFLAERGTGLVVLTQGIDTATVAGRFTFHVLAAMDEMLADLISEGTKEGLASARARRPGQAAGPGGRKPELTARQAEAARGMYDETGSDGKHRYTVAEIAGAFAVSRKTIYRHLDNNGAQRQPDKSTRPPVTRPGPPAGPKRSGNARISRSSGSAKTAHPGRSASTGTARAASPTSNAAPLNARTAATAHPHRRPRRSAPQARSGPAHGAPRLVHQPRMATRTRTARSA